MGSSQGTTAAVCAAVWADVPLIGGTRLAPLTRHQQQCEAFGYSSHIHNQPQTGLPCKIFPPTSPWTSLLKKAFCVFLLADTSGDGFLAAAEVSRFGDDKAVRSILRRMQQRCGSGEISKKVWMEDVQSLEHSDRITAERFLNSCAKGLKELRGSQPGFGIGVSELVNMRQNMEIAQALMGDDDTDKPSKWLSTMRNSTWDAAARQGDISPLRKNLASTVGASPAAEAKYGWCTQVVLDDVVDGPGACANAPQPFWLGCHAV